MDFLGLRWFCTLLLLFVSVSVPVSVSARCSSDEVAVVTVDVHETKVLIGSGHRYLDVRTVEEFTKGQLENSLNVPYVFFTPQGRVKNPDFVEQVSQICSKDDQILVGCQSGVRSLQATEDLLNAGFKNVKNVGGGYAAWLKNGFGVIKQEEGPQRSVVSVNLEVAKRLLDSGHRYLDVRTEEEFKKGHLENALNVPFKLLSPQGIVKNPEFIEQVLLVCNKEDHIVVGCQSREMSLQAASDLLIAGFKNVKNMEGGYDIWTNNDFVAKKVEEEL